MYSSNKNDYSDDDNNDDDNEDDASEFSYFCKVFPDKLEGIVNLW